MKNLNVYTFSQSDSIRHIVIDHSVLIEEIATETIGRLLEIDWKTSSGLGYNSGSLSFYQKVLLIKDKVGIDSIPSKKIEAFYQIRNKFAHIREIGSWSDFFSISKTYQKIERDLENWYKSEENNETDYNNSIRLLYYYLTRDIFYFLIQINIDWAYRTGQKAGQEDVKTKLLEFIKERTQYSEEINDLWNSFVDSIKSDKK